VLHRLIEPAAPSSGMSPVGSSGTVPNLFAANSRNPQSLTQRPVQRDYAFDLLPGLGSGDVGDYGPGFGDRIRGPRPEGHPSSLASGTGAPGGNLPRARP
jgi:hypothetical protein